MAKPLRSEENTSPKDIQFAHFGVLQSGNQGKGSIVTSLGVNAALLVIAIVIGAATKATIQKQKEQVTLVVPIKEEIKPKPPEPPKPPKILPKPPVIKPVEPKIVLEKVKIPDPPKIVAKIPEPKPLPPVVPAPPKQVIAAAAPKPVAVNLARAASVVNNDAHPTAVALGRPDNPIAPSSKTPVASAVNLGQRGLAGMPASNTGGGPRSTSVNLGSGQPNGSMTGTGARAVVGVKVGGVTGGTGTTPGNGIGARAVALGGAPPPPQERRVETAKPVATPPKVTYKPNPVYTAEAQSMHLEGDVSVRIRVLASGQVQVLGVVSGLGHGLDESAIKSVQATRFQPARDAAGNPIDWEGVVRVKFQLA